VECAQKALQPAILREMETCAQAGIANAWHAFECYPINPKKEVDRTMKKLSTILIAALVSLALAGEVIAQAPAPTAPPAPPPGPSVSPEKPAAKPGKRKAKRVRKHRRAAKAPKPAPQKAQ